MEFQLGETRLKHGNRAVILDIDNNSIAPIIGKVLSKDGWSMQFWYADGQYYADRPSQWDLVLRKNPSPEHKPTPEPEKEQEPEEESMLVNPYFSIDGKPVYLYALQDILHSGGITPLRVSRNINYGDGYIKLDAMRPTKEGDEFKFAIANPVYDNRQ